MTILILYWHTGLLWRAQAARHGHTFIALDAKKDAAVSYCATQAAYAALGTLPCMSIELDIVDNNNGSATVRLVTPFDQVIH